MKRANNAELDDRIHKFLDRKFSEFPELDGGPPRTRKLPLVARYSTKIRVFIG